MSPKKLTISLLCLLPIFVYAGPIDRILRRTTKKPVAKLWQVLIHREDYNENHMCTGTLVSYRIVLTTASCLFSNEVRKMRYVSSNDGNEIPNCGHLRTRITSEVDRFNKHEKYDRETKAFDFALLLLKSAIGEINNMMILGMPQKDVTKNLDVKAYFWTSIQINLEIEKFHLKISGNSRCLELVENFQESTQFCALRDLPGLTNLQMATKGGALVKNDEIIGVITDFIYYKGLYIGVLATKIFGFIDYINREKSTLMNGNSESKDNGFWFFIEDVEL